MPLHENIKKYRLKNNLTQKELAERSCVTRESIGNYERGDRIPPADILSEIANALGVSINALLLESTPLPNYRMQFTEEEKIKISRLTNAGLEDLLTHIDKYKSNLINIYCTGYTPQHYFETLDLINNRIFALYADIGLNLINGLDNFKSSSIDKIKEHMENDSQKKITQLEIQKISIDEINKLVIENHEKTKELYLHITDINNQLNSLINQSMYDFSKTLINTHEDQLNELHEIKNKILNPE